MRDTLVLVFSLTQNHITIPLYVPFGELFCVLYCLSQIMSVYGVSSPVVWTFGSPFALDRPCVCDYMTHLSFSLYPPEHSTSKITQGPMVRPKGTLQDYPPEVRSSVLETPQCDTDSLAVTWYRHVKCAPYPQSSCSVHPTSLDRVFFDQWSSTNIFCQ